MKLHLKSTLLLVLLLVSPTWAQRQQDEKEIQPEKPVTNQEVKELSAKISIMLAPFSLEKIRKDSFQVSKLTLEPGQVAQHTIKNKREEGGKIIPVTVAIQRFGDGEVKVLMLVSDRVTLVLGKPVDPSVTDDTFGFEMFRFVDGDIYDLYWRSKEGKWMFRKFQKVVVDK